MNLDLMSSSLFNLNQNAVYQEQRILKQVIKPFFLIALDMIKEEAS